MSAIIRQFLRIRLLWCERAVDRPYSDAASRRLDRRLVAWEGRQ